MKKSILILSLTAAMFSCKKTEKTEFTPTDVTGNSVVRGKVTKEVIIPNGSANWSNSTVGAAGVKVNVTIRKSSLYPNSNAQGADVYSTTTDSLGNYAITVKSNAAGVNASISFDGFISTLDTVINGVTKTGLSASYSGNVQNRTLIMGQSAQVDYNSNATTAANPNNIKIGTATVTGSLGIRHYTRGTEASTSTIVFDTTIALANRVVYLDFSKDPTLLTTKTYTTTTDANGKFTFNVSTVASGTSGFNAQNATIWIPDMIATRDTLKAPSSRVTGKSGVFNKTTLGVNGIYTGDIKNANYINYNSFTQD
ncbi:MAG: hypothetical protein KF900_00890 [Bacteroidetes bacterium]|nr:hypothetical protein [Bacteroidota bacterium]